MPEIGNAELLIRFSINILAVTSLLFGMYWPRYKNKEITLAAIIFNTFTFGVLSILSSVKFSVSAGFGLFAILALFSLRSEAINKSDMAYFFGAVAIAVITAVDGTDYVTVLMILLMTLSVVFLVDHPRMFQSTNQMLVTLDSIPDNLLAGSSALNTELSERLNVNVVSARIISVDYVTEIVRAEINYKE